MMRLVKYISKDEGRAIDFIEMTMRPDFQEAVKALRNKWSIDPSFLSEDSEEAKERWLDFLENTSVQADVRDMLRVLKISSGWEDVVHQYLVEDSGYAYNSQNVSVTKNPNGLVLEQNLDEGDFVIRVGPEATFDDLKKAWYEIKETRKSPKSRKRNRENFLRDLTIFHLVQRGKTLGEIYRQLEEDGFGDIEYGNIKKIYSTFATKVKIDKKNRPKLKTSASKLRLSGD